MGYSILKSVSFKLDELNDCNTSLRIRVLDLNLEANPGDDILNENIIISQNRLKRDNKIELLKYNVKFPETGLFIVLEWLDIDMNCDSFSTPIIKGGFTKYPNSTWLNYRDKKWAKIFASKNREGEYMAPSIQLEVKY